MDAAYLNRKDDFGQLSATLNKMRESVRELLVKVKGEADNIDTVVQNIESNVTTLNEEIEDVSATTEELAASTEETAASAEQISTMSQEIEGAAKGIAVRAQDGATEAEEIHKRARETKDNTVKNRAMVTKMLSEIRESIGGCKGSRSDRRAGGIHIKYYRADQSACVKCFDRSGKSRRSRQGICGSSR